MSAVISSRTPEGEPFRCPICGGHDLIEPSPGSRDATCPSCGHLSFFPLGHREHVEAHVDALLRSVPRLPLWGTVKRVAARVRRTVGRASRRKAQPVATKPAGVWDDWLDG